MMKILHLEDSPDDVELVRQVLREEWPDCEITWVATQGDFLDHLQRSRFDVILSDFKLPGLSGLDALRVAREHAPDTPFIFVSGTMGEDRAIEALRSGAEDYVLKDRMKRLNAAIARALRESEERRQRREAEHRIREQAALLNQAGEAIFITDLEDRISYWNEGAERLYGWKSEEVIGRRPPQLFDFGMASQGAGRDETFAKGQWAGELRTRNRAGEILVVESRQTLIRDEAGNPKARVCINADITGRKRLEEQFLRAQRMENIGLLAAGIAHDLNNMLAPILLAAPMLREHISDSSALAMLGTLEKSAERGANLVRQILAFAHGATGEQSLLQVKHLLRDTVAVMGGTFPKSIKLEDYIPGDLWTINANPTQIHQVLLNLCVNARDAMPNGGTLRLRAENQLLDAAVAGAIKGGRAGAFLVLQVEDTGTGISPEVLAHMWEPFFTTKGLDQGTGLGLSTVRGIVESLTGFVDVKSVAGRGTKFRVYLPAVDGPVVDPANPAVRPIQLGNGELILMVDDERNIREMTATMLTRNGYRVILAADGAEAVMVFAERGAEIRLVITDLHMPNLDGAMLSRALRRIKPGMKVLVVSGMSSALGQRPGFKLEEFADGFLQKPFKPAMLLAKVHELLRPPGASSAPLSSP